MGKIKKNYETVKYVLKFPSLIYIYIFFLAPASGLKKEREGKRSEHLFVFL